MSKPDLDQLRIERDPEHEAAGRTGLWIVLIALLIGAAAGGYWFWPDPAVEITTATVRELRSDVASTVLNASGYVTARCKVTVSSKVTGKVMEVMIEEGMRVEKNQVLARLDDSNVRASHALAEAQLSAVRTAKKETQALLTEAELNFQRTSQLVERGLASEAELDRNRALTDSLAARLELREADIEVAKRTLAIYEQQLDDNIIRAAGRDG